uniref:Uncharacterized protein Cx n=1 Tax=Wheat dwarf virus TaxID=10834 RepID=A6GVI1_9GEMI|nr:hypothetical protein [Wheat dwarf virus]
MPIIIGLTLSKTGNQIDPGCITHNNIGPVAIQPVVAEYAESWRLHRYYLIRLFTPLIHSPLPSSAGFSLFELTFPLTSGVLVGHHLIWPVYSRNQFPRSSFASSPYTLKLNLSETECKQAKQPVRLLANRR